MTCPACGATTAAGARFCQECGQRLGASLEERRVATVLMADLVGFTTISAGADPEQIKRLVDHCFERLVADITAFGGRLDKIVGDEIIALFGAPIAHEDDAERAVRCALRMQFTLDALRTPDDARPALRIAVHTGEVLVGALRAGGDYTAMGDVVNTASRLQMVAEPGWVIVGPETHATTEHAIQYEALGEQVLRGRSEPVAAWRALAASAPPGSRQRARTPLVGRDAEVGLLRSIVDVALVRRRAHLVLVSGGAGVGKSRLVSEVARHAAEEHHAKVLTGRCVPYGEDVWWPIAETIRAVCDIPASASHEVARARVYDEVAEATGRDVDAPEVARVGRGLLYLLGFAEELGDVDPARARDDALRSGQALFGHLADRFPTVLVLSDLHWADGVVLDLIDRLLGALRATPFVLLATARPDLEERWSPEVGRHNLSVLNLEPLDRPAVATLVAELLGADATPELTAVLHERSGGNPFFIEELAALFRESDPAALMSGRLPATLQGLVTARLDGLDPDERDVIADCAVIGASGPVAALAVLSAGRGGAEPLGSLARVADREMLEFDHGEFRFPSEVVREVAYGRLTKAERARRHAVLADWLADQLTEDDGSTAATERVAHHYGTAAMLLGELGTVEGTPSDLPTRALAMLDLAAERARHAERWPAAARLVEQALAVLPADAPDEARWRLQLAHATAAVEQRELAAARADVDAVLDDEPDPATVARAQTLLADIYQRLGDPTSALAMAEEALAGWRALGDARGAADVLRVRGLTYMFNGDQDAADRDLSAALDAFLAAGDRRGEAWALQNLATIAFFRGEANAADDRLERSVAVFTELGDYGGVSWCRGVQGWVRFMQGRVAEAEALAREQLPEVEAMGNRWGAAILVMLLANLALWSGESDQAVVHARDAVARFEVVADPWGQGVAGSTLARALACRGRVDDAFDVLQRGASPDLTGSLLRAQLLVHLGEPGALPAALHVGGEQGASPELVATRRLALGLALAQDGRFDEAVAELRSAQALAVPKHTGSTVAVSAALALALAAVGQVEEARALADEGAGSGTYLDQIEHAMAGGFTRLRAGDPEAPAAFDALVAFADGTEARLDQAITRLARAHAWRALGRDDADMVWAEARRRLDAMGITAAGWSRVFSAAAGA
jgi:class 3 adenylate cyclase/tetratricopeptide (TPR) repeat protein